MWRIIRYGFLLWIVGLVITILEVRFKVSKEISTLIFYGADTLIAIFFFWLFFTRASGRFNWRGGLRVGLWWIAINLILSALFFQFFYGLNWRVFASWHTLGGALVTLLTGTLVAYLVSMKRASTKPEGLA